VIPNGVATLLVLIVEDRGRGGRRMSLYYLGWDQELIRRGRNLARGTSVNLLITGLAFEAGAGERIRKNEQGRTPLFSFLEFAQHIRSKYITDAVTL
jgi:hypothetical protein